LFTGKKTCEVVLVSDSGFLQGVFKRVFSKSEYIELTHIFKDMEEMEDPENSFRIKKVNWIIISLLNHQKASRKVEAFIGNNLTDHTSVMLYSPDRDQLKIMKNHKPAIRKEATSVEDLYSILLEKN